jgi:hypothetical protein
MARTKTISLAKASEQVEAAGFGIVMRNGSLEVLPPGERRPNNGQMIKIDLTSMTHRVSPYELRDAIAAARRNSEA